MDKLIQKEKGSWAKVNKKKKQAMVHNSKNWQAETKAGILWVVGTRSNLVGNEGISWHKYHQADNRE